MTALSKARFRALSLAVASMMLVGCGQDLAAQPLAGSVRTPHPYVAEVAAPLADGSGSTELTAEDDGLLVLYFGYTSCPDVCPTTMADLGVALTNMDADSDRVSIAMLTVDPDRDTQAVLDDYLSFFVEEGISLRTQDAELLRSLADQFGANYSLRTNAAGDVEVSHTGSLYAIDDDGNLLVSWPYRTAAQDMTRDLEILLARQDAP